MKHNILTNKVMKLILQEQTILLNQFDMALKSEENDQAGYFVDFSFTNAKPIVLTGKIELPDVIGKNKNGEAIIGFTLFIKNGLIDYLEGYAFGDNEWPESDDEILLEVVK